MCCFTFCSDFYGYSFICSSFVWFLECWEFVCVYWFLRFCCCLTCRQLNVALVLPFIYVNNVRLIRYAAFACDAHCTICSSFALSPVVVNIAVVAELTQSNAENDVWKGLQFMKIISLVCLLTAATAAVHCCCSCSCSDGKSPLNLHIERHTTSFSSVQHLQNTEKTWLKPYRLRIRVHDICHRWKLIECCFVVILWKCHFIVSLLNGNGCWGCGGGGGGVGFCVFKKCHKHMVECNAFERNIIWCTSSV